MTIAETAAISAAFSIISEPFKKSITDIYTFAKEKSETSVRKWRAEKGINDLYQHVESIRKVKTIWQIDKAVDLREFYVAPNIKFGNKRIRVSSISNFPEGDAILIEGIAGQGKSTLLRYLCSSEMIDGDKLPIFVELRRIKNGESIFDYIIRYLDILGISMNTETIKDYLKNGRLSILLDGFDEVGQDVKSGIIDNIEELCARQKNCRIIITSRPNQTIRAMPCLTIYQLDNLKSKEYKEVIIKISETREYSDALIKVVEEHKGDISGILCTPLFVTLLAISYKSYQQIPEQLSDFYDSLFRVLLQRHDGTKPSYTRNRKSKLNDINFRLIFESFCFNLKSTKKNVFNFEEINGAISKSIDHQKTETNPVDVLSDIEDVTCLIIRDGEEWRFIHKSIQDYFVASYIKNKPEVGAKKIYDHLAKKFYPEWGAELSFLSEIDTYRYAKFFYIPAAKKLLGIHAAQEIFKVKANNSLIKSILGCYNIKVKLVKNGSAKTFSATIEFDDEKASPIHELLMDCAGFLVSQAKQDAKPTKTDPEESFSISANVNTVLSSENGKKAALQFTQNLIDKIFDNINQYENYIKLNEQDTLDDIFS